MTICNKKETRGFSKAYFIFIKICLGYLIILFVILIINIHQHYSSINLFVIFRINTLHFRLFDIGFKKTTMV